MWREAKGGRIIVGEGTHVDKERVFFRAIKHDIVIGRYCDISFNVFVSTSWGNHFLGEEKTKRIKPVKIGDYCWIAFGAMIRGGVTIEDGGVVAMGSVVLHDVPSMHIVGGNPARVIGIRPDADEVRKRLRGLK